MRHYPDDIVYKQIQISGSDALAFLQGQLTQDIAKLDAAVSLPAAWCNPKGRVIAVLRLLALQDSIGLVVPASLSATIVQRLGLYRLRSQVTIAQSAAGWRCMAVSDAQAFAALAAAGLLPAPDTACRNGDLIAVDYSTADRFIEVFGDDEAFTAAGLDFDSALSDGEWTAMKIKAGRAEITNENSEQYTPHMLNLDRIGAISFKKGCYTGQEIVARTQNLGESKRRLQRYRCAAPGIAIGDKLSDEGRDAGTVVNVSGNELLAVTPVATHAVVLTIDGTPAVPVQLPYDL
jgi:hypothetical protein